MQADVGARTGLRICRFRRPPRRRLSLRNAIGLLDLAVQSPARYEALALDLARDCAALGDIKARLAHNRATHPPLDTARFTRHIERGYAAMWERHQRGEPPDSFAVAPLD